MLAVRVRMYQRGDSTAARRRRKVGGRHFADENYGAALSVEGHFEEGNTYLLSDRPAANLTCRFIGTGYNNYGSKER